MSMVLSLRLGQTETNQQALAKLPLGRGRWKGHLCIPPSSSICSGLRLIDVAQYRPRARSKGVSRVTTLVCL